MICNREEAINLINKSNPERFLRMDKKQKGCVCPACGNGKGADGDGLRPVPPENKSYKCFKCGFVGDVLDLVGIEFNLSDFNNKLEKACEIFGIDYENSNSNNLTSNRLQFSSVTEYIGKCKENIDACQYMTNERGLSKTVIEKFNIGWDSSYDPSSGTAKDAKRWSAIIIPTSDSTYEARNIDVAPNDENNKSNKIRKFGKTNIFNKVALSDEKEKPIFIVEGAIDAMSIIDCDGQAIAIGSTSNINILIKELSTVTPQVPLIICFDNDEAGKTASAELESKLTEKNIPYITAPEVVGDYHDANDRLIKDKQGLIDEILNAVKRTENMKTAQDILLEEYQKSSSFYNLDSFFEKIEKSKTEPVLSTGFYDIDSALDGGLKAELYTIGAISSLGKTTFSLQIADNLAKQGIDVIFISLEQSKNELMAKSISRETYQICIEEKIDERNAKSMRGIINGKLYAKYSPQEHRLIEYAVERYKTYSKHIYIHEGIGDITVSQIREIVKKHISATGNKPVVFVDYLQILQAEKEDERSSDKTIIDHNISSLKRLSRDMDIPIWMISSLNRQSYDEAIKMSAFKESGMIEYSADVVLGLQFANIENPDFDAKIEKSKEVREVNCVVLKNRNGKLTLDGVFMKFNARCNHFSDTGEFVPVNKNDENDIPF